MMNRNAQCFPLPRIGKEHLFCINGHFITATFTDIANQYHENELPEGNFSGISVIKDLIESVDLSYKSAETAKRVGYLGYIDNATKIFHNNSTKAEVDQATTITDAFYDIFESSDDHLKDVAETFKNIFKDQYSRTDVEKFKYDNKTDTYICPEGNRLYLITRKKDSKIKEYNNSEVCNRSFKKKEIKNKKNKGQKKKIKTLFHIVFLALT